MAKSVAITGIFRENKRPQAAFIHHQSPHISLSMSSTQRPISDVISNENEGNVKPPQSRRRLSPASSAANLPPKPSSQIIAPYNNDSISLTRSRLSYPSTSQISPRAPNVPFQQLLPLLYPIGNWCTTILRGITSSSRHQTPTSTIGTIPG